MDLFRTLAETLHSKSLIFCSTNSERKQQFTQKVQSVLKSDNWTIVSSPSGQDPNEMWGWGKAMKDRLPLNLLPESEQKRHSKDIERFKEKWIGDVLVWNIPFNFDKYLLVLPAPLEDPNDPLEVYKLFLEKALDLQFQRNHTGKSFRFLILSSRPLEIEDLLPDTIVWTQRENVSTPSGSTGISSKEFKFPRDDVVEIYKSGKF